MDRDLAVRIDQQAIKAKNKRLVDAVLRLKAERERSPAAAKSINELPLIAVTCARSTAHRAPRRLPGWRLCSGRPKLNSLACSRCSLAST